MSNKNLKNPSRFLEKINELNYKLLGNYNGANEKTKIECDKGHIFYMRPRAIVDGQKCPVCNGNKILIGYNDFNTTHKELSKYLKNYDDGFLYSYGSHKKVDWICPICGNVINDSFHRVSADGIVCKVCSDGISYPEKFMMSILKQLNIDYLHNVSFDWSEKKKYDFVLHDYKMIVECHGEQHYRDSLFSKAEYQIKNDLFKRKLLYPMDLQYMYH